MNSKEDRIKSMLGSGLSGETVASAVGVDPSYISQLLSNEIFMQEVIELRSKSAIAHTQRDLSIDGIEDSLILTLKDMIEDGRFMKPEQVLNAFRVINGAKRRGIPIQPQAGNNGAVVPLQIPTVVKNMFTINISGEVIDVNGQTLVTMPSGELIKTIADRKGEDSEGTFNKLGKAVQIGYSRHG